jgi:hypothetical protein
MTPESPLPVALGFAEVLWPDFPPSFGDSKSGGLIRQPFWKSKTYCRILGVFKTKGKIRFITSPSR